MASEQEQVDAVLAALNAALAPKVAYDVGDVPLDRPNEYVEVFLTRRYGGNQKASGHKALTLWRITVRAVSRSSTNNVRLMLDKCREALEFRSLPVGADATTSIQFENARTIAPDEGWFTGAANYTYSIHT